MNAVLRLPAQKSCDEAQGTEMQAECSVKWMDATHSSRGVSMGPSALGGAVPLVSTWGQQPIVRKGRKDVAMELDQSIRNKTKNKKGKPSISAYTKAQSDGVPHPPVGNAHQPITVGSFLGRECWTECRFAI